MMQKAMEAIQEEIMMDYETFQQRKQGLQRSAKVRREAAAHNQGTRETIQGLCVLRYLVC